MTPYYHLLVIGQAFNKTLLCIANGLKNRHNVYTSNFTVGTNIRYNVIQYN